MGQVPSVGSKNSTPGLGIISVVGAASMLVNEDGLSLCLCVICCSKISVMSSAGHLRMGKGKIDSNRRHVARFCAVYQKKTCKRAGDLRDLGSSMRG